MKGIQHRGQEGAGVVFHINDSKIGKPINNVSEIFKNEGSVDDLFKNINLDYAENKYCTVLGHTRYSTAGKKDSIENIHPFIIHSVKGSLSLIHNGNLTNVKELKKLINNFKIEVKGNTDSELILLLIKYYWNLKPTNNLEDSIIKVVKLCKGSLNLILGTENTMYVYRDPSGNRPFVEGIYVDYINKINKTYIVTSESSVLDSVSAKYTQEIDVGTLYKYRDNKKELIYRANNIKERRCIFEDIYFSRPDSLVEEEPLHNYRSKLGKILYSKSRQTADYIVGVPDSGITAAIAYANESNIPYVNAFVKNRYIGRTFIQPTQKMRQEGIKAKLNIIPNILKDKEIILIDDSIVRGNTSKIIINNLRKAGVKKIHLKLTSPPIINTCNLGMDFPSSLELLASNMSIAEIKNYIDVDSIMYLSVEDIIQATVSQNPDKYCTGCFNGKYLD